MPFVHGGVYSPAPVVHFPDQRYVLSFQSPGKAPDPPRSMPGRPRQGPGCTADKRKSRAVAA